MKIAQSGCPVGDRRLLSSILADERSRRLLHCLQDGPLTVRDLAVDLAAADLNRARAAISDGERQRYRGLLQHSYLPRLTDAGLLSHSADGLVSPAPAPLDRFRVQFPGLDDPDHPSWPAAAAVVCRRHRYPLLAMVAEAGDALPVTRLAERLAETDDPRSLAVALHHVDLPKLASLGLLSYDTAAKTVTSTAATETVL